MLKKLFDCSKMLESARKLLEIFAAQLENCLKYMLLGSARLEFFEKMNCSKMLGSNFIFPAQRALGRNASI